VQFYGTTETFIITLLRPEQHRVDNPDLLKSCGQPMPGVKLRIVDPNGRDLPAGEAGEVLVRSPWMFSGYWNKPDATASASHRTGSFLVSETNSVGGSACSKPTGTDSWVSSNRSIKAATTWSG
jgi:acyl-CoA synthetase (AMP-forming)/AMP-acid ligase II